MNDTLLGGLIAGGITLINLGYNYLAKKLELGEKQKDRDFKIQEVFINKAVETLQETAKWVDKIDSVRNKCAETPEPSPTLPQKEFDKEYDNKLKSLHNFQDMRREIYEWHQGKFIYLPRDINTMIEKLLLSAGSGLRGGKGDGKFEEECYKINKVLRDALNKVALKYNPLFNLDLKESVKEVERDINFSKGEGTN